MEMTHSFLWKVRNRMVIEGNERGILKVLGCNVIVY